MGRLMSALFALALLIALIVAVDPNARRKAEAAVQNLPSFLRQVDDTVVVDVPSVDVDVVPATVTPEPTATPAAALDDFDEDSSDEPFIVINWDALVDSLRNFWESLKQIKIDVNPRDNN